MMAVDKALTQDFQSRLRGTLIDPEDDGYDAARKVYNAMIDKRPALIAQCAGTADVIAAVNFARTHDLPLAVRAGGHSVAGNSMCDAGLVIDLTPMQGVRVDPVQRTARAEGGVTWGGFDHETQAFGLATTGGIASTTGLAGLTRGGGIGYLNRKYGLACDNLLSADVVLADGRLLTASATEHPDLFWALRGGSGNFGVVTSLEYRVHPVGPVLAGLCVWPLPQAKEVLRFYREFSIAAPDELRLDATLTTTPVGPGLAIIVCWCGAIEEGERVVKPLRAFGPPAVDTVAAVPYKTIQTLLESMGYVPGLFHYWKSSFIKELSDDAIATLVDTCHPAPGPLCAVALEHLGGAIARIGDTETAFTHRHAQHSCLILAAWADPTESNQHIAWARQLAEATKPFLEDAVYVNYLGEGEGEARVRAAYGANYERLVAIKQQYDPANLFRLNQNIRPTP
jgi:FAD/FMN-containing dehydrogenase